MHNAFVAPGDWAEDYMALRGEEARHLISSVRAKVGDQLILFDGKGKSADAFITSIQGRGKSLLVNCEVRDVLPVHTPSCRLTLLQALPKGNRMDTLVEKVSELGAWEIVPLKTDRVEKQPGSKGFQGQVERWTRVSLSAAKQCGSPWIPGIRAVQSLDDALSGVSSFDLLLVCVLDDKAVKLSDYLSEQGRNASNIAVLIGPEGDLADAEIAAAVDAGAVPVNFGKLVMRVETAAIYATSVLKNHFRWDSWE